MSMRFRPVTSPSFTTLSLSYEANLRGNGITIAVITESDLRIQDVVDFRTEVGLPANTPELIFNGPPAAIVDMEPTLDSSWAGAIAPDASIKVVISAGTGVVSGLDLSELYAVDNNIGDVITESYSNCELQSYRSSPATAFSDSGAGGRAGKYLAGRCGG